MPANVAGEALSLFLIDRRDLERLSLYLGDLLLRAGERAAEPVPRSRHEPEATVVRGIAEQDDSSLVQAPRLSSSAARTREEPIPLP